MTLDLSSLKNAVSSLKQALNVAHDSVFMNGLNQAQQETIRAGVIQNFEFTYELCWKFIQRWIRANVSQEDASSVTRKDLFRIAAQRGLIQEPQKWFDYSESRNMTSHTYDREQAESVFEAATKFIEEAESLLKQREAYND